MAVQLTVNGVTYNYPELQDEGWGPDATNWAVAITQGTLTKAGGLFSLTSDIDFGPNFGLKSVYYKSRSASIATVGQVRLANADVISYRNALNAGNLSFGPGSSDAVPQWNSIDLVNLSTAQSLSNKTLITPVITGSLSITGNISATGTLSGSNFSGSSTGSNTGDVTLGTANGLSLVGQALSLGLSSTSTTGSLTSTDWNTFNSKQTAGSYITALTGDVTASGPGSAAATVASVGTSSAGSIHSAELLANAATNLNTASAIVKRDASGNFVAGTITANLSGNATTATSATSATTAGSATNFTGSLVGDVTGTQGATVVSTVGTSSAANVHTAELLANAATALNTASAIVKRDSSGNFTAGTITATLSGNATNVSGVVAIANGGTAASTANAAFNNLSPMTTNGDLIYRAAGIATRLPIGTDGYVLSVASGIPTWVSPSASGFPILAPDGTAGAPSYSFASDPDTGIYRGGQGIIEFTSNGGGVLELNPTSIIASVLVKTVDGSVSAPSYTFSSQPTTGMYWSSNNSGQIKFTVASTDVFQILASSLVADVPIRVQNGNASAPTYTFDNNPTSGWYLTTPGSVSLSISGTQAANFTAGNSSFVGAVSSGTITATSKFRTADGTASVPSYSFSSQTNTGIYWDSASSGQIKFAVNAVNVLQILQTAIVADLPIRIQNGSAGIPQLVLDNDATTGIYGSAGNLNLSVSGTQAVNFSAGNSSFTGAVSATGQILAKDGIVSSPGYSFSTEHGLGLYRPSANQLAVAISGALAVKFDAGFTTFNGELRAAVGNVSVPHYSFSGESDKGMYDGGTGNLAFATAGTQRAYIDSTGLNIVSQGSLRLQDTTGGEYVGIRATGTSSTYTITLPASGPGTNTFLKYDGTNYTWGTPATGTGDINNGGNAFGAAMTIGTTDAFGLNLETNSSTKASISSAGLVTIGASGSTQQHLVQGDLEFRSSTGISYVQESLKSASLANNTTGQVYTTPVVTYQHLAIDYSLNRGLVEETGTILVVSNGTTAQAVENSVSIGDSGITFDADVSAGNLRVNYTSDNSGSTGTIKFAVRKW